MAKNNILTAEQEKQLRQPIEDYVGKIQAKLDELREDGTNRVVELQNDMDSVKRDHIFTQQEKEAEMTRLKAELEKAKAVEDKNKGEVSKLIADAENYLKGNFDQYYQAVVASCKEERVAAQEKYKARVAELEKEHQATVSKLTNQQEIKAEKYGHKNRLVDAKQQLEKASK